VMAIPAKISVVNPLPKEIPEATAETRYKQKVSITR